MVGSMVNGAFKGIEAAANPGMHMLYDKVNKLVFMATKSRTAAHKAGDKNKATSNENPNLNDISSAPT